MRFRAGAARAKFLAWAILAACLGVLVIGVLPTLILELDIRPRSGELSPLELAQAKNNIRSTVLQTLAGLGIVAGAVATWRTLGVNREGQITEGSRELSISLAATSWTSELAAFTRSSA